MLAKKITILRTMMQYHKDKGGVVTVGEVSRASKIPKSTVRRLLTALYFSGHVDEKYVPYKSTGKRIFGIKTKGVELALSQKALS